VRQAREEGRVMTTAEFIQGFRDFADWLEQNQEALDTDITRKAENVVKTDGIPAFTFHLYRIDKDEFAAAIPVLGRGTKSGDDRYFQIDRDFGPVRVTLYTAREKVCRKIVTRKSVEAVEWVCEPSILAAVEREPEAVA
jgi:hypothetical protein